MVIIPPRRGNLVRLDDYIHEEMVGEDGGYQELTKWNGYYNRVRLDGSEGSKPD